MNNLETFLETVVAFLKNGSNGAMVLYACVVCLITQAVKKAFVNKVKVNLLHNFDVSKFLPFVFGLAAAVVDRLVVQKDTSPILTLVSAIVAQGLSIGALATVIFKFFSSLSGKSMAALLSDDVFAVFYDQLVYFSSAKQKLLDGDLKWSDFIEEISLVARHSEDIYSDKTTTDEEKKQNLLSLLSGIIDKQNVTEIASGLHKTLLGIFTDGEKKE